MQLTDDKVMAFVRISILTPRMKLRRSDATKTHKTSNYSSLRRKPESRIPLHHWIPAFAEMTKKAEAGAFQ
jgi:hypothetical protein